MTLYTKCPKYAITKKSHRTKNITDFELLKYDALYFRNNFLGSEFIGHSV